MISELQKVVAPLATKDDVAKLGESIRSDMGHLPRLKRCAKVDQRFTELEAKNETAFANLGKSQARGFPYMAGLIITAAALLFAALQYFGPGAAVPAPAWDPPPNSAPSPDAPSLDIPPAPQGTPAPL